MVLSRRDYDALLASLGDEDAEDRMTALIVEEGRARRAAGLEPPPIPSEIAYAILDGASPLRAIRVDRGLTLAELAGRTGMAESLVADIDGGSHEPSADERQRLAKVLDIDPRWLEPL